MLCALMNDSKDLEKQKLLLPEISKARHLAARSQGHMSACAWHLELVIYGTGVPLFLNNQW